VLQLQAIFTILLAVALLHERPSPRQLLGAAVAIAGIGVIGVGRAAAVPAGALLLAVVAALCWGLGNTIVRAVRPPDALALLVWSSLVAPWPLAAASLWREGGHRDLHALAASGPATATAVLYVVLVSTIFGFGTWTWLMRRHPASRVAPFTLLVPVVGIAAAWIARGEQPNGPELLGAAVVLAGLALTTGVVPTFRLRASQQHELVAVHGGLAAALSDQAPQVGRAVGGDALRDRHAVGIDDGDAVTRDEAPVHAGDADG